MQTAEIQLLNTLTFVVGIEVHDIYGASGTLISSSGDDDTKSNINNDKQPILMKQSSELILDKQNIHDSRLDSLTLKIEELLLKFDNIQNGLDSLDERQTETDLNINSLVNEIKNMKEFLGDEYKSVSGDLLLDLNEDNKLVKNWLENDCKMGQYFKLFVEHGIDNMAICKLLSMDNLETMGITKLGHRVQILHQIAILNQNIDKE